MNFLLGITLVVALVAIIILLIAAIAILIPMIVEDIRGLKDLIDEKTG